ncbi:MULTISPECIES: deoxyribose-phosphate aldolase [Exiguobacterium]|uniref:Deoxyribose-phosphate aldolase n=1 Tax=Exiguobacterium sibiricum (strain DSM 17290 / CCUG 55495 / CIP 109462 / JCM 13490 / 255-15) TaxID=262543 RepID=DEOC_EXIS2|nr:MULTISPECIES: deoxyribose-phosphate aldolase [Exiguobacterium]B1YKT7.1 RecName: Full=Deoxyribose-phosphate aldolase; Short=DERA; AltName: Full=2-deoxy-D-ribose 5-phosphate aldolase; AltName: Full=Phosphodeoxyriboaldolase; Short=Deoxyriboaldolase [Exiguobacterium sibiricum 255-15]ACB60270.1 deoxyribose-phosphate aldolase [Exiguobacterium sibiricum 255-15]MCT4790887.1 deoxyribose-phosphate aldolase [Exiguobacterium artemiae]MDW2886652.1 deoxyribose-phosphate aldolase [Exiguobacterium sibiricum
MNLAGMIDHTALKAETSRAQIETLCKEALEYKFASVCVNPTNVALAAELLKSDDAVKVCTVIGFPLGANTPEVKAFETQDAIKNGATEIDMVLNIGALKDGDLSLVERDIRAVVEAANGTLVKVIFENCLLTKEEIKTAAELSVKAGADFVKTSTGFSTGGATVEDIRLMRETVGPDIGVKASGGVRDFEGAKAMIDAGATRIGASAGIAIVTGGTSDSDY